MDGDYRTVRPEDILLALSKCKGLLKFKVVRALVDASPHRDKSNLRAAGCGSAVLDWPEGGDDWWHRTGIARDHGMTSRDDHASAR